MPEDRGEKCERGKGKYFEDLIQKTEISTATFIIINGADKTEKHQYAQEYKNDEEEILVELFHLIPNPNLKPMRMSTSMVSPFERSRG